MKSTQVKDTFHIHELQDRSKANEPERLEHFEILYVRKGTGTIAVGTQRYAMEDNTVYCLAQGQYRLVEPATGYCISLSQEFLYLSDCITNYGLTELVMMANPELNDLIGLMYLKCVKQDKVSNEILRNLLKAFIMICMRRANQGKDDLGNQLLNDERIVKKFFSLLQQNVATRKLVAEYADELCITPNYLNAVVKRQTGSRPVITFSNLLSWKQSVMLSIQD